jgi:hypothetical protein
VFAHFAVTVGGDRSSGTGIPLWISLGLAIAGAVVPLVIYVLGGARPETPRLERFFEGDGPAWDSPTLLADGRDRAQRLRFRLARARVRS